MDRPARVGILGGSGYAGAELLRLLSGHPGAEVVAVTSRHHQGKRVSELFPSLRGHIDIPFEAVEARALAGRCDVVLCAVPHGVAMHEAPPLLKAGVRVVDLSADFRIADRQRFEYWYDVEHACPELLAEAVYGLPEVNGETVRQARLVASPGCYPTAVQLALAPLLEAGAVSAEGLVADAKSGVSGAGREAKTHLLFAEAGDSMAAYGVGGHRHLPEILQGLERANGGSVDLTFVPHLTPMIRGIHATCYAEPNDFAADLQGLFEQRYSDSPFVDVLPPGSTPQTRSVRGSNFCRISVQRPAYSRRVVVLSVIDNLVKGAAGQAVQNMNLMLGRPERDGLEAPALLP
jgi:N-acetyl-gamma-glutamyl-phosphate reductase